tara:strand:+ start:2478 stop:3095 length:618 start_codon:yes stop_codon:yes gene_type:complete
MFIMKSTYVPIFRRRREHKTSYDKRKIVLQSKLPFLSIYISNKHILLQILQPKLKGDLTIYSVHSNELKKFGWKGANKNIPAAYLLGLLSGYNLIKLKVNKLIFNSNVNGFTMDTRSAAVLKGIKDSEMNILTGDISLSDDRINAKHISSYAAYLLENDKSLYTKQFANVVKNGLKPEQYHDHFTKVKDNIILKLKNNKVGKTKK